MSKRVLSFLALLLLIILLSSTVLFQPAAAQVSSETLPVVAIHVSENTQANWNNPAWKYFAIYQMLEEAFKSDGTPFVEISDASIESGGLLVSGAPKYPILFSLASECISDLAASQISSYVSAGGFVYVGASSWTRYANGAARSNFALSSQMGLSCDSLPPNNWGQVETAMRTSSNRLVNHVPTNVAINWRLPLTDHSVPSLYLQVSAPHYAWKARTTTSNPAQVLMTISGRVMLAIKPYSNGMFIYHSEVAPLAAYSIYSPIAYEYQFFREAVQWAFESHQIPLARLSSWPYQYNSAFVVRHDMDISYERVPWIVSSATTEKNLGITGQYYIVTGDVRDASNRAYLVSQLQQAQALGAQIGSHNGGLNATPWNPSLRYGDYEYYHWGPDYGMSVHPSGVAAGMAYANNSIKLSFDDLQSWLGQRPNIWVSPAGQSCWDESYQIMESLGIKTSGEMTTAPYPQFAFSVVTQGKRYDTLMVPFSRWITNSGTVCQSMEELAAYGPNDITKLVDFYYNMGALVSPYSHSSSSSGLYYTYLTYTLSKSYMWKATPSLLRDWSLNRQQIGLTQSFKSTADGLNNLTLVMSGSSSPNTAFDVRLPLAVTEVSNLQVLLNGIPTANYRLVNNNLLKVQAGMSTTITVLYSTATSTEDSWTQTSQSDFLSGTLTNLDANTVPGQLTLALQAGGQETVLFSDDFSNASWTGSQWTVRSGSWSVSNGYYNMISYSDTLAAVHAGDSSWTDYAVEARVRYVSGYYSGGLDGRVNPGVGSRYCFLVLPNWGGPNVALLFKFSSWQDISGTLLGQASVSTDTNWHNLRMEFTGNRIKCYYDGNVVFDVVDGSYASGRISLESYDTSTAAYDWVNVTSFATGSSYYPSGTLVSSAFDSGGTANWDTISWTGSTPTGTTLQFRTRTSATQAGLASAAWSDYYTVSGSAVASPPNRWIQYEAKLTTVNNLVTPVLYDVTITYSYSTVSSWIQTSQADFQSGTLTRIDSTSVPGQLTLALQPSQTTTLFFDDFSNASWTSSQWSVRSGSWTVSNGYYNMISYPDQLAATYAGSSWSNFAVETRVRYVSGYYSGELGARVNPSVGSRYSFLIFPNWAGPNVAMLLKFSSWQDLTGTLLGEASVPTDTNWHILRMELNGNNIKCFYDGGLVFNVNDNSYTSGRVSFESYDVSTAAYDWINVTSLSSSSLYYSSGTLVSSALDSGSSNTNWQTISWTASTPAGTTLQFRTKTAATQAGLTSAPWSENYTVSGSAITSPQNRWIQYEVTFKTSNSLVTPILYDVKIDYSTQ